MRNIEILDISFAVDNGSDVIFVQEVVSRLQNNIHLEMEFLVHEDLKQTYNLSPSNILRLANVESLGIEGCVFYLIWSNKCTRLSLDGVTINKDWCEFVMKHCDFSNITSLALINVRFDYHSINESLLKQLAYKFKNLKRLKMKCRHEFGSYVVLFWQLLNRIIITKNNVKVELDCDVFIEEGLGKFALNRSSRTIHQHDLKIESLVMHGISGGRIQFVKKIDESNKGCHRCKFYFWRRRQFDTLNRCLANNELSFKCIKVLELEVDDRDASCLIDFLALNIIIKKQLFIIVNLVSFDIVNSSLFAKLCKNIHKLFVNQIAVDITILFPCQEKNKRLVSECLKMYSKYFESKMFLSEYKKPKCNTQLCLPRSRPLLYLEWKTGSRRKEKSFVLRAKNVEYI